METNTLDGIRALKGLNIPESLLPNDLTHKEAILLYDKLKNYALRTGQDHPFNESWQIDILLGRKIPTIEEIDSLQDTFQASPLHYLAWSGNITKLISFLDARPAQLDKTDIYQEGIINYITFSGNAKGFIDFLNTYPYELNKCDNDGQTIIHFIINFSNVALLKAFIKTYPKNMASLDNEGCSYAHYAAYSRNGEALSLIWPFIGEANQATFYPKIMEMEPNKKITVIQTIVTTLESNHHLPITDDMHRYLCSQDLFKPIVKQYEHNRQREVAVIAFKMFLTGFYQDNATKSLPLDVLKVIFHFLLAYDASVTTKKSFAVANTCIHVMKPAVREANRLISDRIKALSEASFSQEKIEEKITALERLKALIHSPEQLTLKNYTKWYQQYEATINAKIMSSNSLFKENNMTEEKALTLKICQLFQFDEKVVTEISEKTFNKNG